MQLLIALAGSHMHEGEELSAFEQGSISVFYLSEGVESVLLLLPEYFHTSLRTLTIHTFYTSERVAMLLKAFECFRCSLQTIQS